MQHIMSLEEYDIIQSFFSLSTDVYIYIVREHMLSASSFVQILVLNQKKNVDEFVWYFTKTAVWF